MSGFLVVLVFTLGVLLIWQSVTSQQMFFRLPSRKAKFRPINWPDVVDDIHSAIRAGMSLPQAIHMLGESDQNQLSADFKVASLSYSQNGDFKSAMINLGQNVKDPTCDKFVAALVIAYDLGGADLGRLLSTLSESLRADTSIRGEIHARQSWTVNGARLALAAPWLTVMVLSTRSDARHIYFSNDGMRLLLFCGFLSAFAYFVMHRLGQLPREPRLIDESS